MTTKTSDKVRCSFCGKSASQVRKMIAGSNNTFICDECIELCSEILEEEFAKGDGEEESADLQTINLLKPKELKEFLGHTFPQVVAGAVLGILVGWLGCEWFAFS